MNWPTRICAVLIGVLALLWVNPAGAHDITFEVQDEAGQPVEGSLDWVMFGPTGVEKSQSAGGNHTVSVEDGEYTVILMRTGAPTAQDFTFRVEGGDKVIPVTLLPIPDLTPPEQKVMQWVTIRVLNEPASKQRITEYRWALSREGETFFRKSEPAASLNLRLPSEPTDVTITRMPDRETVQFSLTPDSSQNQEFAFEWPAVSIGAVLPEDKRAPIPAKVTLAPRLSEGRIIVALSFETGVPAEGDTVWLTDGGPGGIAMSFVEPDSSEVVLILPGDTPTTGLRVMYRRAQTLTAISDAPLP